jgi:hypothetical protein
VREFEAAIVVPHGGIEYMAGGTSFHPQIEKRALVGKAKATATAKTKSLIRERQKQSQNLSFNTSVP